MRILYDYQIFGSQQYGGISRYFYQLANELAGMEGQEIDVFAPLYVNDYFRNGDIVRPYGIKIPRSPHRVRLVEWVNSSASRLLVRPKRDVDIYHETYYSLNDYCPSSAKRITTVHDMIQERLSDRYFENDLTSQKKALAVERADHVICVSENTRKDLIELLDVDPKKISVVHHGFALANQGKIAHKTVCSERPFLLYVGYRGGYKNFRGLFEAYVASPVLRNEFDLICFGGGEFTSNETDLFQRLGISMKCIRQVSGDDATLATYYKMASAFVYPSIYEGFGIPPLEAMSFDCPVVCSSVSSIPEVVGDAAEMCNPYEPDMIRMAIERVVCDDALRESLIFRGRERIKLFSWERCARETLDAYCCALS